MMPDEICRQLGEEKARAIFLELTTEGMKKVLREAKIPTTRLASHNSVRRRNIDWSERLWRLMSEHSGEASQAGAALLFDWLTRTRRLMLAEFLTAIEVTHERGLTDADFMTTTPPEKLCAAGEQLLAHHDRQEVAAYLLFLDSSNKSEIFQPLDLERWLAAQA